MNERFYRNSHEVIKDIPNISLFHEAIGKYIYQQTGKKIKCYIMAEALVEDPFADSILIEIELGTKYFVTKIQSKDVPKDSRLSFFINKIKEQYPQLFI